MAAMRVQQALADAPLVRLMQGESLTTWLPPLVARIRAAGAGDHATTCATANDLCGALAAVLDAVYAARLSSWACDWIAVVCSGAISSSKPEEQAALSPASVLSWAVSAAAGLHKRVLTALGAQRGGEVAGGLDDLHCAASSLSAIVTALLRAAPAGAHAPGAAELSARLALLLQTTRSLQFLEVMQQQRPGLAPPLARSSGTACSPAHANIDAWQDALQRRAAAAPGGRLFLHDLQAQLRCASPGQADGAYDYPWRDPAAAVAALFMSGDGGDAAWRAKLSLLSYYLTDGGWLDDAAPFAQGFQLPLNLAQQWRAFCLTDAHMGAPEGDAAAAAMLDQACALLSAAAAPGTPFRCVEALLAAGAPMTALAVQRARCSGNNSNNNKNITTAAVCAAAAGETDSLQEALVTLRMQLACGLLPEAFAGMRTHTGRLPPGKRTAHLTELVAHLGAWAVASMQQQQQETLTSASSMTLLPRAQCSRLQQLCELPWNAQEEAVLFAWLCSHAAARGAQTSSADVLQLYLLQRGRVAESLLSYQDWSKSAAAAGAAASPELQRHLASLAEASSAALPPGLLAALPACAGAGAAAPAAAGVALVAPLVGCAAAAATAPAISQTEQHGSTAVLMDTQPAAATTALATAAATTAAPMTGGLFAAEVAAAAGPGAVLVSSGSAAAAGMRVPLLFGAPVAAAALPPSVQQQHGGVAAGDGWFGSSSGGGGSGGGAGGRAGALMTGEEFSRSVLGLTAPADALQLATDAAVVMPAQRHATHGVPAAAAAAAAAAAGATPDRRSSKRQRQTPVRFNPGTGL